MCLPYYVRVRQALRMYEDKIAYSQGAGCKSVIPHTSDKTGILMEREGPSDAARTRDVYVCD